MNWNSNFAVLANRAEGRNNRIVVARFIAGEKTWQWAAAYTEHGSWWYWGTNYRLPFIPTHWMEVTQPEKE